jgi:hypothetical protein
VEELIHKDKEDNKESSLSVLKEIKSLHEVKEFQNCRLDAYQDSLNLIFKKVGNIESKIMVSEGLVN